MGDAPDRACSLDPTAVRAFLGRDWAKLRDRKDRHWVDVARREGGEQTLCVAEDLRRHVERFACGDADARRAEDLAHLIELKKRIDAASAGLRK